MADVAQLITRVRTQMARGQIVLFTGAGFSDGARDRQGNAVPMAGELRDLLLEIAFPGEQPDPDTTLGEAFAVALRKNQPRLRELLERRLSIASAGLPEHFKTYFNLPWFRVYTLNVDDLELAVGRASALRRNIDSISATNPNSELAGRPGASRLEVVHLNGMVGQAPASMTFSETQYGERAAGPEVWLQRCVADLRSKPVIFVGTTLRESTLWQHIELRKRHQVGGNEILPPGSILVTNQLSRARAEMLSSLNIEWHEGTAESFAKEVLEKLDDAPAKGFAFLQTYDVEYGRAGLPLVSELMAEHPRLETEYLLGEEPRWADILTGRAAARVSDSELQTLAEDVLAGRRQATAVAVTGTAGAGKSTALMRLAVYLTSAGVPVLWVDRDSRATPAAIRQKLASFDSKVAIIVDDADLYGSALVSLIRDLVPANPHLLFVVGTRANRVDTFADPIGRTRDVTLAEFSIPPLTDADIDALIAVLDRFNRLGILKGKTTEERKAAFTNKCGRQLLVAMFEATTGERFEEKAASEFDGLGGLEKFIYSLVCVATTQRHYLTRDEVILACHDVPGDPLDVLQRLSGRHIITLVPPNNVYRARHRMIADVVFDRMVEQAQLAHPVRALAYAFASKVLVGSPGSDRITRALSRFTNHDFLSRMPLGDARRVYADIESQLADDYHFWLQRGSLEVEAGDIKLAEHFLNQAKSLGEWDYRVQTEYAYLMMRKAVDRWDDINAKGWLTQGIQLLEGVISNRGAQDSYPYHILGSQGIAWVSRTAKTRDDERRELGYYLNVVEQGLLNHPRSRDLQQLRADIKQRILSTIVPDRSGGH